MTGDASISPHQAAVLRGPTAVAVGPLRLPSYSLRSYPFHFCFLEEKKKSKEDLISVLPLPVFLFSLLPGGFPPKLPVALELRRVGVGHRPRIAVDVDAAELQGPWSAPEPRPRLLRLRVFFLFVVVFFRLLRLMG